ncbi:ferritin-like domain-containing protein [Sorangium sp. KYC3313]|uniref:ferritin-like domain-containing protein n=1 Tax=Sorangium sp. KYC3313 TaxID=3449740 RepID=UPI003F8B85F4
MSNQDWDDGRFSIQHWMEHTAWRRLKDSTFGVKNGTPEPHPALWDDPLLMHIYKMDIATFLTAERVSMCGVAGLMRCAPNENCQVYIATQTLDEARHFEVFCRRLADVGVTPPQREKLMAHVTTKAMKTFYDLILEQVDKGDFVAGSLALNSILEGMAYPVYRYEMKYWSRFDVGLSQLIKDAFADEVQHVGFGTTTLGHMIKDDVAVRNQVQKLAPEFHRLMMDVFESIIRHYIGLYQEAANNHMDEIGDLEIFPGRKMADTSEEEQVRIVMHEVEQEYSSRMASVGVELA